MCVCSVQRAHTSLSLCASALFSARTPLSLSLSLSLRLLRARQREEQRFNSVKHRYYVASLILHASIAEITAQLLSLSYVYLISSDDGAIIMIFVQIIHSVLFVCPVLSNDFPISFTRNELLDIRNSTPDNLLPTFEHSDVLLDILVGGAAFLFKRSRRRKRGKRAGALVKTRQRGLRTPLPSIHLANLRSLANKSNQTPMTCTYTI